MIRVGLTGGIGSGKSVVTSLLALYGMPIYIADAESKRLLKYSPQIREQLTALLGRSVVDDKGFLNRHLMASLIFNDAKLLEQVNAVIHPAVACHFSSWAKRQTTTCVVLESAILFESNFNHLVDVCLLVYAPRELRIKRVMARDGLTEKEIWQRMQHQIPEEEKMKRANYVIYNDDIQPLIPQIERWYYFNEQ